MGPINIDISGMWWLACIGAVVVGLLSVVAALATIYVLYSGVLVICCG